MIDTTKTIGTPITFDPQRIKKFQSKGVINSISTLERAIFCLEYLGQLQEEELDLIFKGGSAVQVLLRKRWTRLSIDVDICTDSSEEELKNVLERIHRKFNRDAFSYSPRDIKLKSIIPFYSYKIETPPITDERRTILLDVMGTRPEFATFKTPLKTSFFESSVKVTTPTVGALLGDKLSTIGPTTIGRNLKDSRNGLEYCKHFHDINGLQESDFTMKESVEAYYEAIDIQSKVRNKDFTINECVDDMVFTCQVASLPLQIGEEIIGKLPRESRSRAHSEFRILRDGLQRFRPFLTHNVSYNWDDLRKYAAKTALLAGIIKNNVGEKEAKGILKADFAPNKEQILALIEKIKRLSEEKRWFIEPSEIGNFPKILKLWHDYFFLEELI